LIHKYKLPFRSRAREADVGFEIAPKTVEDEDARKNDGKLALVLVLENQEFVRMTLNTASRTRTSTTTRTITGRTTKIINTQSQQVAYFPKRITFQRRFLNCNGQENIVNFFIQRPIFAMSIALVMIVAGAVCMLVLPIAQYPPLVPPQVQVAGYILKGVCSGGNGPRDTGRACRGGFSKRFDFGYRHI
jgi:hypothetical protein